jgi:uncharacterized protein (DUF433 family)
MKSELIISDPQVMMGKPIVAGTRITVELILEKLAAGETMEQLLAAYPRLTREGIQAALEFAAKILRSEIIYPVPA